MPTARGEAGTRRRSTRVNCLRWAWPRRRAGRRRPWRAASGAGRAGWRGDGGLGAAPGAGLAQRAGRPPGGGLLVCGGLAGDAGGAAGPVAGVAGEDPGGGVACGAAGLVLGLAGLGLARAGTGRRRELGLGGVLDPRGRLADRRGDRRRRPARLGRVGLGGGRSGAMPRMRHQRRPSRTMRRASSSLVRWASRHTWRSCPSFSSPMTAATALATGSASALRLGMPAFSGQDQRGGRPGLGRAGGRGAAAVKSPITIWQVHARSQARSAGRRVTWRASIRDSSSAVAAAHHAALVPWGRASGSGRRARTRAPSRPTRRDSAPGRPGWPGRRWRGRRAGGRR